MVYADYEFYCDVFHGDMSEAEFLKYSRAASDFIDCVTFGRITQELMSDEYAAYKIRSACCECADIFYSHSQAAASAVTQEKVGDYSVSYAQQKSRKSRQSELYSAAKEYLYDISAGDVKLMYRGG